jgi:hypothetical protein
MNDSGRVGLKVRITGRSAVLDRIGLLRKRLFFRPPALMTDLIELNRDCLKSHVDNDSRGSYSVHLESRFVAKAAHHISGITFL